MANLIFGIDRLFYMSQRICLLIEFNGNYDDVEDLSIDSVVFREVRMYDMSDPEQCAIQFVRELVACGEPPDPDRHRIVVIGGDSVTTALNPVPTSPEGGNWPVTKIPFSVWIPEPPAKPEWRAKKV